MNNQNKKVKLRPKIWKRDELLSMLQLLQTKCLRKGIDVLNEDSQFWKIISTTLKLEGIEASPEHCQRKWLLLYNAYTANPSQRSIFFKIIEQILNVGRNGTTSQADDEEQSISNDEMECVVFPGIAVEKYESIEDGAESAPIPNESTEPDGETKLENSMDILQALCRKIDALAEVQRQQERRIEQIFLVQKASYKLLLGIKDRLK